MGHNIWEKSKKVGAILFHALKSPLRMKDFPHARERLSGMWMQVCGTQSKAQSV